MVQKTNCVAAEKKGFNILQAGMFYLWKYASVKDFKSLQIIFFELHPLQSSLHTKCFISIKI